jgi:hypothetical protein
MDLQEQIEAAAVRATSRICAGRAASFGSAGPEDRGTSSERAGPPTRTGGREGGF